MEILSEYVGDQRLTLSSPQPGDHSKVYSNSLGPLDNNKWLINSIVHMHGYSEGCFTCFMSSSGKGTLDGVFQREVTGEGDVEICPRISVTRPTAFFGEPVDSFIPVTLRLPAGDSLRQYLVNPGVISSDAQITHVGVAGPNGWGSETSDRIVFSGTNALFLTTTFEPWNTTHFRGTFLAFVSTQSDPVYVNLGPPAAPLWDAYFGSAGSFVVDDGQGGAIIDFFEADHVEGCPEGSGGEGEGEGEIEVCPGVSVARPTAFFGMAQADGRIPVTLRLPAGATLRQYLVDPSVISSDAQIMHVGVAGPNGWGAETSDTIVFSGADALFLTTTFESLNPGHFRGTFLAFVSTQSEPVYVNLGPPAEPLWDVYFGSAGGFIVEDEQGNAAIDFAAADYAPGCPDGSGGEGECFAGGEPDFTPGALLQADGQRLICRPGGAEIKLRGIAFTNGVFQDDEHDSPSKLVSNPGSEEWYREIKQWGFNTVRLYMTYRRMADPEDLSGNTLAPEAVTWLNNHISWAQAHGVYIILNMHYPPDGRFQGHTNMWVNEEEKQKFKGIWLAIARQILNNSVIGGLDLLNEPVPPATEPNAWSDLAQETTTALRIAGSNHMVVIEQREALSDGVEADWCDMTRRQFLIDDENVLYDAHFYRPHTFTLQRMKWNDCRLDSHYPDPASTEDDCPSYDYGPNTRATIYQRLREISLFGITNNVPMSVLEFGTGYPSFLHNRGGLVWMSDVMDVLAMLNFHFSSHAYIDQWFGVYRDGEGEGTLYCEGEGYADATDRINEELIDLYAQKLCGSSGISEVPPIHTADQNGDGHINLSELLRVIQFFNSDGFHCAIDPENTEDGYVPGPGDAYDCSPHGSDYNPSGPSWTIDLTELLRLIQFYNVGGYYVCPGVNTEDGYCPGIELTASLNAAGEGSASVNRDIHDR